MPKFSVKKPFTVLVGVIAVLVVGAVALFNMTTDLLPQFNLPYMIVVTTYPGASPERVEADVTSLLEASLGTINGVASVTSTSAENYSMVQLEFEDKVNMDSALVKVTAALNTVQPNLPELCGTPSVIELSLDMLATMYVAVSEDDMDIYQMSDFADAVVMPYLERQNGIASVSGTGLVEKSVHVELDQKKIDELNQKLRDLIAEKMDEAEQQMNEAADQVSDAKKQLANSQATFGKTLANGIFGQLKPTVNNMTSQLTGVLDGLLVQVRDLKEQLQGTTWGDILESAESSLQDMRNNINNMTDEEKLAVLQAYAARIQAVVEYLRQLPEHRDELQEQGFTGAVDALDRLEAQLNSSQATINGLPNLINMVQTLATTLTQAQMDAAVGFSTATITLTNAEAQLESARLEFETQKAKALESANLDAMLSVSTLSGLIYAQNFEMPAGYIDDKDSGSWLLKIGQGFSTLEELQGAVLANVDGIGDITLSDVATVTVIDNADQSYAKVNGNHAVVLSVYKTSTVGTNEASRSCQKAFDELTERYPNLHFTVLMNQGDYITIIINSVLSSMLVGALLAIVVLALFLKDIMPTLVVAISIPLSVLFAIVLMYFSNLSMNMMTLSGLALGIGMLVDNSVVVMENIYRLRNRGISSARAAVQGTRQVAGSIVSSTLTTVCVFLPLVFASGMVQELLAPVGFTIGYTLGASLLVAMTVVPASASTLLKNTRPKNHPWFEAIQNLYARTLRFCLKVKIVPLALAIALLGFSVYEVMRMGLVLIPSMSSNEISVNLSVPEDFTREEAYRAVDEAMAAMQQVDKVKTVGIMNSGSTASLFGMGGGGGGSYRSYTCYIIVEDGISGDAIDGVVQDLNALDDSLTVSMKASSSGMSDMSSMLASGLSVNIYGDNMDTITSISEDVMKLIEEVEGFSDASNGLEEGAPTVFLRIDKDAAMRKGVTVAQIYQSIAMALTTEASNATVTLDRTDMKVTVINKNKPITVENLLSFEIKVGEEMIPLSEFAHLEKGVSATSIARKNQSLYMTVSAATAAGQNTTLLARELQKKLDAYQLPNGYSMEIGGESSEVNDMVYKMAQMMALALVLIYLIMVAQFQSLLSPFIVLFTIPLAFTGGMIGLLIAGEKLSIISLMGFLVLMGTVVNNGIVFVDYTNQLRKQGLERRAALVASGRTRLRPIWMTALTTILAMMQLMLGSDMGSQMGRGMAIVVAGGLLYATFMTLYVVPVLYDIMFKKQPLDIDIGSESLDDIPDDAAEFMASAMDF